MDDAEFLSQALTEGRMDMIAKILGAALLSTGMIGGAMAQPATTPSAPNTMSRGDMATSTHNGMWRSSKLIGVNVYNEANEKLGSINDLILDADGRVENVVIGVGGFLGMGEHNIAVKFADLKMVNEPAKTATSETRPAPGTTVGSAGTTTMEKTWYPDHAVLANATKEQLKAMPQFKY